MTKTITMDYEEYQEDIEMEQLSGRNCGVSSVMKYLESGKSMTAYILANEPEYRSLVKSHPDNFMEIDPNSHWGRILKALEGTKFN